MAAVLAETRPRLPRSEQNTPASFLLALSMHALLVGALWISVQWRTEPASAVVVELWGSAPGPAPEPVVLPPPAPPAPALKVEPQAEPPKPDIAFKEEKKPPPDTAKIEAEKQRAEEARRLKAEQQQRERELELKKQELEQKKQRELEQKKQAEAARAAEFKRDDERREALRKSEAARVLAQAGSGAAGGSPGGTPGGTPGGGGRGETGYGQMLAGMIKPRIVFAVPDGTSSSVYADFDVDLLPTGEILRVRLIKSSGLPGYDAAVERAIRRTDPFPRKADGTVDRTVPLRFFPVEK